MRRYVLWLRIAIARVQAGADLADAAYSAGFADSAHLTRTCREPSAVTPVRIIARYGYVPFLWLGVNGAAIDIAAAGAAKYWLLALLALAIAVSLVVERIIPYDHGWKYDHSDSSRDGIHLLVNEILVLGSVAAIPLLAEVVPAPGTWPRTWPFVVQVMVAIIGADAGITLVHRASHINRVLWRFHAVHHSITRFYGLNGLIKQPVHLKHPVHQTVEMVAGAAPLILIGLPIDVASALALAVAIQLLLQHSNADYRIGPAQYALALKPSTASGNRRHRENHHQHQRAHAAHPLTVRGQPGGPTHARGAEITRPPADDDIGQR